MQNTPEPGSTANLAAHPSNIRNASRIDRGVSTSATGTSPSNTRNEYDHIRGAAVHEAGHAIAARAVGYEVISVSVFGFEGLTRYRMPAYELLTSAGRSRELVVTVAGLCAELLCANREEEVWSVILREVLNLVEEELQDPGILDEYSELLGEDDGISAARVLLLELEDPLGESDLERVLQKAICDALDILRASRKQLGRDAELLLA